MFILYQNELLSTLFNSMLLYYADKDTFEMEYTGRKLCPRLKSRCRNLPEPRKFTKSFCITFESNETSVSVNRAIKLDYLVFKLEDSCEYLGF